MNATPPPRPAPAPLGHLVRKLRGDGHPTLPRVSVAEIAWSWLGAFLGIGALGLLSRVVLPDVDRGLLVGSMGASAVLVYGAPRSPLAQPRAVVGGHVLSATVGVGCWQTCGDLPELAAALAVSTSIVVMHLTRTLHPPGGATALIAVIGSPALKALGFGYALLPVGLATLVLVAIAVTVNTLAPSRKYPEAWW